MYEQPREARERLNLEGEWRFRLDGQNRGVSDKWYSTLLPDVAHLPGSTDENGYGDEPHGRDPDKLTRLHKYVGPAWYQTDVSIPDEWRGKRIALFLERCHWETMVWIDEEFVGCQDSLCAPHEYDLSERLGVGEHQLTIRVDNSIKYPVGELRGDEIQVAHSVTEYTQTNWNGIVGRIELATTDRIWIKNLQVYPDLQSKTVRVVTTLGNCTSQGASGRLLMEAVTIGEPSSEAASVESDVLIDEGGETGVEISLPLGDEVREWDDIDPALYCLTVSVMASGSGRTYVDQESIQFGMREFYADGSQLVMNGHPVFLRGTVECAIFPLTGYPPMDLDSWLREFGVAKSVGLNCFRFHSWCPPEAAFEAADQLGFLLHIETPVWTYLGEYDDLDQFVYDEGDRILRRYGNHPSFCMLLAGNEPHGENVEEFLTGLLQYWKSKDSRRLYGGCSGWPEIPASEFHIRPQREGKGPLRAHAWGGGLQSRMNAEPPTTVADYSFQIAGSSKPIIAHEIGQWCAYPNLDEIERYTGVLRAVNYEIVRDSLAENHMVDQAHDFTMASGALQVRQYREEIESALRTPGFGGFEIVCINDYPGEGTAVVGVLDAFWDPKPYLDPADFSKSCASTVPLARMNKRIWTNDETFTAEVEIAHFGRKPIESAVPTWSLHVADGEAIASGELSRRSIPVGNGISLGTIRAPLEGVPSPIKLMLKVNLKGTDIENCWEIWVYPPSVETGPPEGILLAYRGGEDVERTLRQGGRVLLMPHLSSLPNTVPAGFTTIFWNTRWTKGQPPHTLGILCDPEHPALEHFPTEYHSNWHWWDLVTKARAMDMTGFPAEFRPIVQVIDDWNRNRKLGLLFEAKVARGSLLFCSIDLFHGLERRPVARQLLHSLLSYVGSDAFAPGVEVDFDLIRSFHQVAYD
jgi:hypothetical protein